MSFCSGLSGNNNQDAVKICTLRERDPEAQALVARRKVVRKKFLACRDITLSNKAVEDDSASALKMLQSYDSEDYDI